MVSKRRIIWDDIAKDSFKSAIDYIKTDSPQNADKVKLEIRTYIRELIARPERHPKDKYKEPNDGSYRAFELYRLRVSYFMSDAEIRIVRIRHTHQEPKSY